MTLKNISLFFQLVGFLVAVGFSAGGGNFAESIPQSFIYLKGIFLGYPVVVLAYYLLSRPRKTLHRLKSIGYGHKWLLLYFLFAFLSIPLALHPFYSLDRLVYTVLATCALISLMVQYAIYTVNGQENKFRRLLDLISILALAYPALVMIHGAIIGNVMVDLRSAIQSTGLIHSNLLSSFLAHLLVWHMCSFFLAKEINTVRRALLILLISCVILLLLSRTVLVSLVFALFMAPAITFILYRTRRSGIVFLFQLFAGLTAILLIGVGCLPAMGVTEYLLRDDNIESLFTLTNRTLLWSELFNEIDWKIFLTGQGYSVITKEFGVDFGSGILYSAHNAYLSILLGSGIFTLGSMIFYLGSALRRVASLHRKVPRPIVISCILSYMIFIINCITADEIGINLSITFSYLIFITYNIDLFSTRECLRQ